MLNRVLKDETDQMDLEVGIWKSLVYSPPPEVDNPTYDIVGPVEKYLWGYLRGYLHHLVAGGN